MSHSMHSRFGSIILALTFGWMAGACGSDPQEEAGYDAASSSGGASATGGDAPSPAEEGDAAPRSALYLPNGEMPIATLHRLTRSELTHSLQDLLGSDVPIGELEPDVQVGGFSSIGASTVAVSPAGVGLHEQQVLAATGHVFADEARARAQFACLPENTADVECSSRIIAQFGRRAFRRLLTEAEIQRFTGLVTGIGNAEGSNVLVGVRYALAAVLQSPSFLYRGLPQRNSPTARGKFVSEMVLCRNIPPPPNNVPPLPPQAGPEVTMRERLAVHRQSAVCASCHSMMDPIGFGMEDFDSVGLHRTMEGTSPVDATGTLEGSGLDGSAFNGLAELGAALRRQPVVLPCLVSKVYAEALGRRAVQLDRSSIDELSAGFSESQNRLGQLLITLVTSEAFRFVEPTG